MTAVDPTEDTGAPGHVLELTDVRELFEVPGFDPFDPVARATPGLDEIAADLRTRRRRRLPPPTITLLLPTEQIDAGLEVRVRAAVDRYCAMRIAQARSTRRIVVHEGWSKLRSELVALPIIALVLALFLVVAPALPPWVAQLFTPLITITIWVAIWNPVDSLLFDRWAADRTAQVYGWIREMEVVVRPARQR